MQSFRLDFKHLDHMSRTTEATHPNKAAFPPGVGGPALRALRSAGVRSVADLARWTEADLAALHGMGPKALGALRTALEASGGSFRRD
jgi:hypothetical protein